MRFTTTIAGGSGKPTGMVVPEEVVDQLGGGKRPAVAVTIGKHSYRSTVGTMGGTRLVPLSAEHRAAAGVEGGQRVEVELLLDEAPRETPLPDDVAGALTPMARQFFDGLAPSHRKEWVRWIEGAKKPETRASRVEKAAAALAEGRKTR